VRHGHGSLQSNWFAAGNWEQFSIFLAFSRMNAQRFSLKGGSDSSSKCNLSQTIHVLECSDLVVGRALSELEHLEAFW
jgi:hypothetical protein